MKEEDRKFGTLLDYKILGSYNKQFAAFYGPKTFDRYLNAVEIEKTRRNLKKQIENGIRKVRSGIGEQT